MSLLLFNAILLIVTIITISNLSLSLVCLVSGVRHVNKMQKIAAVRGSVNDTSAIAGGIRS